jgi:hypothetical protein
MEEVRMGSDAQSGSSPPGKALKALALGAGLGVAIAAFAAVAWLRASGRGEGAGFIGPGSLLADLNLVLEIALLAGLAGGALLARRGNIEAHRVNQTIMVGLNTALVASIMAGALAGYPFRGIADLLEPAGLVTWLHGAIGTASALSGLWLVLQMNDVIPARFHLAGWKRLMRYTLAGYAAVALSGISVYWFWNVG